MKKLLGIVVLGLLLSGNAFADEKPMIGMSFLEVEEFLGKDLKADFPMRRSTKKYIYGYDRGGDETISYGFEYEKAKKTDWLSDYLFKKYKLTIIFNSEIERYDYYLNRPEVSKKDKARISKTKALHLKHIKFVESKKKLEEEKIEAENKKQQDELAKIIDKSKTTCKTLGFEEGTEKFSDCTLKLYTQEIDNKVALEVAKQKSSSSSTNSGTMIIYDPVRDRQNTIDKGMEMITGGCTLGKDC